jgi:hypothetical protein
LEEREHPLAEVLERQPATVPASLSELASAMRTQLWEAATLGAAVEPPAALVGHLPFDELGLKPLQPGQGELHWENPILLLDVPAQRLKARDLGGHDERFGGNFHRKVLLRAKQTGCPGLLQSLDFDLAERLQDPFRGAGFGCLEEDFRRRLREHGLGVLAVAFFELAASLEAEDDRVSVLAILGHGSMELGQFVEAGELVEYEPDRLGRVRTWLHHAQDEQVEPS